MQLSTTRFGVIEIDASLIFTFAAGLPGFPDRQRFVLLSIGLEETPFIWMQSVSEPDLCFLLVDPSQAFTHYSPIISRDEAEQLQWEPDTALQVLCLVTVPQGDLRQATVNLKAPLWFNPASKLALQSIIDTEAYSIRHPLFAEGGE